MKRFPVTRLFIAMLLALGVLASALLPATAQDSGSAEDPLPIGTPGQVGDYEVTVLSVMPDAAETVLAYNEFNANPAPGSLFFMARIQVTYIGESSGTPWLELSLNAVGRDPEAAYTEFENSCGDIPESGSIISTELFTGGTIEYNVCWAIDRADAASLVMHVSSYAEGSDQQAWFLLGDPALATPETAASPVASPVALASTRTEPLPIGSSSLVGNYTVEVVAVEPNATETIVSGDSFNEPPADGNQFYLVTVSVTNQGDDTSSPWLDLNFKSVGDRSVGYSDFNNSCGAVPNGGQQVSELPPGDTVEFNVCWQIPASEAESLVMYVDLGYVMDEEGRTWFSIQP